MQNREQVEAGERPEIDLRVTWQEPVLTQLSLKDAETNRNNGVDGFAKS